MRIDRHGWPFVLVTLAALSAGTIAWADEAKPPAAVLASPAGQGELFESPGAGIAVRPPAGCKELRRTGIPDVIVEFLNDPHDWQIRVLKTELVKPKPLDEHRDENGNKIIGYLQECLGDFRHANPAAKILRQEVIKAGGSNVGVFATRFTRGATHGVTRRLYQEALIPLNQESATADSKLFYVITMNSPGAKTDSDTNVDPGEKQAADAFADMIDSVKLLDRGAIRKDQDERLSQTETLLPVLMKPELAKKAMISEQGLRIVRDGKDVGYAYLTEAPSKMDNFSGVEVTVRSHTVPLEGTTVDVVSRMFISDGWTHEAWMHSSTARELLSKKPPQPITEFGITDINRRFVPDESRDDSQPVDPKHPRMKEVTQRRLEVYSQVGKLPKKPCIREDLPSAYLPQAVWYLLPRLVPLDRPQSYMFYSYISEYAEVMARYLDVGEPQKGGFPGTAAQTVIPVKARVGLEGGTTTYFLTPEGKYLGSESVTMRPDGKKSVVQVVCTDAATLTKLWPEAKLRKPQDNELPAMPRPRRTKGADGQLP